MKKTIIITGASSGIGRALAEHLASLNHNVIAVARRKEKLEELQKSYPDNIKIIIADITKKTDQLKIKNFLSPHESGIYLIHNAGIAIPKLITDISEEEWDQHYLINTKTPLFLTKLLLPHLKNGGRVLHISTNLAHGQLPGLSAYSVSKAALFMLKEYFNLELNDQGILFASAMPGAVDTPIQDHIRSYDLEKFPSVKLFQDFYQHNKLLRPMTAAKFLSWLLLEVNDEEYVKGDWSIYDSSHFQHWTEPDEVIPLK